MARRKDRRGILAHNSRDGVEVLASQTSFGMTGFAWCAWKTGVSHLRRLAGVREFSQRLRAGLTCAAPTALVARGTRKAKSTDNAETLRTQRFAEDWRAIGLATGECGLLPRSLRCVLAKDASTPVGMTGVVFAQNVVESPRVLGFAWVVRMLGEGFFDLGGEFQGEGVEALRQIANVLKEIVVGDEGRDSGEKAGGGSNQRFGDTGSNRAKTGGAGSAKSGEGVDDAPNSAEESDEGGNASGGGEPGHTFFRAANFFGRGELHADGHRLNAFHFLWGGRAGIGDLALQFAVAGSVDVGEGRAGGDESLRIGDAFGGAKDSEELVALASDASEKAKLLKDKRPRDEREEQKKAKNAASDPSGLLKNVEDVTDVERGQQENNVSSLE